MGVRVSCWFSIAAYSSTDEKSVKFDTGQSAFRVARLSLFRRSPGPGNQANHHRLRLAQFPQIGTHGRI